MSIIFSDVKKHFCLEKEPYSVFAKKYRALKGNIDSNEIVLSIGNGKEGFWKGFYRDDDYMVDPKIKFVFGSNIRNSDGAGGSFIRMTYSFECNDCNFVFRGLERKFTIIMFLPIQTIGGLLIYSFS